MDLMNTVLPYLLSGISVGGQYALIAIGYTMVYGILRLINFAHGDVFMVAGLMMVYLSASMPLYLAVPLMIVLTVLLGFLIERAAYKPLRTAPRMSVMISAIGPVYHRRPEHKLPHHPLDFRPHHGVRLPHQTGHPDYPLPHGGAGDRSGVAYQSHQSGHGHAGRLPGL